MTIAFDNRALVALRERRLLRRDKSRSEKCAVRTEDDHRGDTCAVCDASGDEDRDLRDRANDHARER